MTRPLLVFGNGLGMALDPGYFNLQAGLASGWQATPTFSAEHRRLVRSAIPDIGRDDHPHSEQQLDRLHMALVATQLLRELESEEVRWLHADARDIEGAVARFVHTTARYFHESGQVLPLAFVQSLTDYVIRTRANVATLNYDNLLYDAFSQNGVLNGFDGPLLDGFLRTGFSPRNLDSIRRPTHGYYLHLHGSPLYIGDRKMMRFERNIIENTAEGHIVLTHVRHKPSVIEASPILREYWRRLQLAISDASSIVLFGYSGLDDHLNRAVKDAPHTARLTVVEWNGAGNGPDRIRMWQDRCARQLQCYVTGPNILSFTEWAHLPGNH